MAPRGLGTIQVRGFDGTVGNVWVSVLLLMLFVVEKLLL